jgi:hypothetical protein
VATALTALRSGALVRVLLGHRTQTATVSVVYASRQYVDAKISAWVDFVRESIPSRLRLYESELKRLVGAE